jgi:EmrB/QacA subfamily drug resistance transporter
MRTPNGVRGKTVTRLRPDNLNRPFEDNPGRALENSTLFVTTLTSFIGPFMISSVNVALPAIQVEFGADAVQLSWIATAYLLATAIVLVPIGKVADIYGRKKIFVAGLIGYTVSSGLAALVKTIAGFIGTRILQGAGAAMFITTGMAILTSVFPPHKRGRAIGIYVAAVYIGLSVGPFAGGLMTQHCGWRSIFVAAFVLGIMAVLVTLYFLKGEWADARGEIFDHTGALLYGTAIFSLVFGATLIPDRMALYLILTGAVGLIAFVLHEKRMQHPLFEVALFQTNRTFAFSSLAALINYSATFAITFLLSLYLQYIKGMAPQTTGAVLMAQPVVMALLSPLAGHLSDRVEPRILASAGMFLTALGLANFAGVGMETRTITIIGTLMLVGFGFALFSSPNMSAIMGAVEKKYYGIASGTVATMRLLGQMFSMASATVVLTLFIGHVQIQTSNYPLFLKSIKISFVFFALLCTVGVYFSFARGRVRPHAPKAKPAT